MDDLEKLAAARDRAPEPPKRYGAMIFARIQRNSEMISARIHSVNAWVIFVALIAFLPVPFFFFVVAGFLTPLLVVILVVTFASEGEVVTRALIATVAIGIYVLPCWGITRLLARGMRALSGGYAIVAMLLIVTLLFGTACLDIYGLGHHVAETKTAFEYYAELLDALHKLPKN
jgi:hypothetical protein